MSGSTAGVLTCARCGNTGASVYIGNGGPYCPWCLAQLNPVIVAPSPCECASLRARLAESERAAEDQARLVGMGSEREARLMAQLSEARGLVCKVRHAVAFCPAEDCEKLIEEIDAFLGGKEPPRE